MRCYKNSWNYLTSTYLLLVTFETNDNYSIQFEISNNSSKLFDSIRNEKNTICTALTHSIHKILIQWKRILAGSFTSPLVLWCHESDWIVLWCLVSLDWCLALMLCLRCTDLQPRRVFSTVNPSSMISNSPCTWLSSSLYVSVQCVSRSGYTRRSIYFKLLNPSSEAISIFGPTDRLDYWPDLITW